METNPTQALRRAAVVPAELSGTAGPPDDVEAWIGKHLADAADELSLDEAIENCAADGALDTMARTHAARLVSAPSEYQASALWMKIGAMFGAQPTFVQAVNEFEVVLNSLRVLRAMLSAGPVQEAREPLWFAYDPAIPPCVAGCIVQGVYSSVAFRGIAYAARTGAPVAEWWKRAIVERWTVDQHEYLRLLASLPACPVPEELVPIEERLDLIAAYRQNDDARAALTALFSDEQRAAGECFKPFTERPHAAS